MSNPFDEIFLRLERIEQKISIPSAEARVPEEIINQDELCRRLDITEPTVIKWRKKGKIPFLMIGAVIRYNWPAVITALEDSSSKQNKKNIRVEKKLAADKSLEKDSPLDWV